MISRLKKSLSLILILGLAIACLGALTSCKKEQVPIYEGMEILDKNGDSAALYQNTFLASSEDFSEGVSGDINDGDSSLPTDPFPDNGEGEGIEEEIKDKIEIEGSGEEMYYTRQNRDVYINIKVNNPDKYEILSFTFNGEKYSDYMFEEGSDLENIIIKVNSANMSGVVSYTIDAMKYINKDNEIKDVIMAGEKTVKVGVYVPGQVSASHENFTVTTNSLSCYAVVEDSFNLIHYFGGKVFAVVYDGDKLLGFSELPIPTNEDGSLGGFPQGEVNIKGLKAGRLYQFGIVAFYDDLKGDGFGPKVVYKKTFRTSGILTFESLLTNSEGADFSFGWGEAAQNREILSLSLYLGEEKLKELDTSATSVTGLLSGKTYRLVAEYMNMGVKESIYAEFTTAAKTAPELGSPTID